MTKRYYKSFITNLADGDVRLLEKYARFYYRLSMILFFILVLIVVTGGLR